MQKHMHYQPKGPARYTRNGWHEILPVPVQGTPSALDIVLTVLLVIGGCILTILVLCLI